jgi:O-antigen/teichoic acid export membrane protein
MPIINLLKNKLVFYLVSRYATYGLQFITSMIIAIKLGPYYMGIWGFILLALSYFQQFHFGVANSLNVLLVHNINNRIRCYRYITNSIILFFYLSVIIIILYVCYRVTDSTITNKYHTDKYALSICIIAILQYFNMLFVNIFRIRNQINYVTFSQSIIVLLNFICIFFFTGDTLINYLVGGYLLGNISCVVLALYSKYIPAIKKNDILFSYQKEILKKGLYLFLYNSCFYLIIISIRTIISQYYSVEDFGLFTFSFTLGNAIMLLLDALAFIIFPKLLSKLSSEDLNEIEAVLKRINDSYICVSQLLIYVALICFPVLMLFIPKYSTAITSLNLVTITVLMNANSFGYSTMLIAKNKEKYSALISTISLIVNIIIGLALVNLINCEFSYVILATMITYLLFTSMLVLTGSKVLHAQKWKSILAIFNYRFSIPFLIALFLALFKIEHLIFIPLLFFIYLNLKQIKSIISISKKIFVNPKSFNL